MKEKLFRVLLYLAGAAITAGIAAMDREQVKREILEENESNNDTTETEEEA